MKIDARSGWATAPAAARLAGDWEAFRFFDTAEDAERFIAGPAQHAARQKRYRQRQRDRAAVLHVAVPFEIVVGALIRAGRLDEQAALDRSRVEGALSEVIVGWSQSWGC